MTITISRKLVVFVAAIAAVVATGVGIAAWSTSGSGNGYAKAATASGLTLSDASASTSANLYPGATSDVKVNVRQLEPVPDQGHISDSAGGGCCHFRQGSGLQRGDGGYLHRQDGALLEHGSGRDGDADGSGRGGDEQRFRQFLPGRDLHHSGQRPRRSATPRNCLCRQPSWGSETRAARRHWLSSRCLQLHRHRRPGRRPAAAPRSVAQRLSDRGTPKRSQGHGQRRSPRVGGHDPHKRCRLSAAISSAATTLLTSAETTVAANCSGTARRPDLHREQRRQRQLAVHDHADPRKLAPDREREEHSRRRLEPAPRTWPGRACSRWSARSGQARPSAR